MLQNEYIFTLERNLQNVIDKYSTKTYAIKVSGNKYISYKLINTIKEYTTFLDKNSI